MDYSNDIQIFHLVGVHILSVGWRNFRQYNPPCYARATKSQGTRLILEAKLHDHQIYSKFENFTVLWIKSETYKLV